MYETSDPDGGALVPPGLIREVWDKSRFTDTPLKRAKVVFVRSNTGVLPTIAESSRVDGSRWGGVLAYWQGEAEQFNKVHGTLANDQYRCKKLTLLIPASDELFEDSGLLDAYVTETAGKELGFQLNRAMINGNGAGMPLGIAAAPASIFVAKDGGQSSGTISATNVQNVWSQVHGPSRADGVWFANEEFDVDTLGSTTSPVSGWMPPVAAPTLKGRPVVPSEWCPTIGTPCDLFFADFSQYMLIIRGLEKAISFQFKFDFQEGFFRFSYRVDGAPLWFTPLTSLYGTKPKSPFVGIAQRRSSPSWSVALPSTPQPESSHVPILFPLSRAARPQAGSGFGPIPRRPAPSARRPVARRRSVRDGRRGQGGAPASGQHHGLGGTHHGARTGHPGEWAQRRSLTLTLTLTRSSIHPRSPSPRSLRRDQRVQGRASG